MNAPLAEQARIVITGIRNAGKSSLMNALFEKDVAIVADYAGTTTDPVTRSFEIPGLGPASIVDTAGIDDKGELGKLRIQSTLKRTESADMIIMISKSSTPPTVDEEELFRHLFSGSESEGAASGAKQPKEVPALLVLSHPEEAAHPQKRHWLDSVSGLFVDSPTRRGIPELIEAISSIRPAPEPSPLEGLVREGDFIILVTPIDSAAPKGRLILPQVETLRDALDRDCAALVVKEQELFQFYDSLGIKPHLVITDSQAFHKVAADIPSGQALTSFSILFARKKGDLHQYISGLRALDNLPQGARVLMLEGCSHHRQADDIGTVKIPRLVRKLVRKDAVFTFARQLPPAEELAESDLVIMCGSCMQTRGKVLARLAEIERAGVPVLNYGLFLAWANGVFPRALKPLE